MFLLLTHLFHVIFVGQTLTTIYKLKGSDIPVGLNHVQVHKLHGNQFLAGALLFVFVIEKEVQ